MSAPQPLIQLIEKFQRNADSYVSPAYNEEQARQEFINPLFDLEILGWDISNKQGYAEPYKDVVYEGGLKGASGTSTFPDYTFRIGGTRKFFVEAKKPSVQIFEDAEAAYQLRRYAWSAHLPLSILTNFRAFSIYDCRFKPQHTDKASTARILYLTFDQYSSQWNQISTVFSKQAIATGSFDKYAESSKGKRGTTEVDQEFLNEIEKWRELLARSIALHNKSLDVFPLNFAVQRIIDRIIFLRMCEDRGIEEYEQLKSLVPKDRIYRKLQEFFEQADQKYNSGIFHFHKESNRSEPEDTLTPSLVIDDDALREIIGNLYYPQCPYAFSVLSVDILGSVYERFLGKVIRLTEGHRAKVEEKPEVKKAGGVYYTPSDIVQFIVTNTIKKLCEGKTPSQISNLRILDPACGSGSFLIDAYSLLLNYHRDWYITAGSQKYPEQIFRAEDNQFYLTSKEKNRILLNNIFGVDKDSQAVEVTKLNLLLKVLEGERRETMELQQKLFRERALPDLGRNIKWGDTLVDPTFYKQQTLLGDEVIPLGFDWTAEFPFLRSERGFTAVIGNPPYLKIEHLDEVQRQYFIQHYSNSYMKRFDAYGLFIDKGISLLREDGLLGMIIPSTILNNLSFTKLRKLILDTTSVTRVINLGGKVFQHVNNDTLIIILKKGAKVDQLTEIDDVTKYGGGLKTIQRTGTVNLITNSMPPEYSFELRVTDDVNEIIDKMKANSVSLGSICEYFQGLVTGSNEAYIIDADQLDSEKLERTVCKPIVFGDDVHRYGKPKARYYVIYLTRLDDLTHLNHIRKRLEPFKNVLQKKREVKLGRQPWYCLHWPRDSTNFERRTKLVVQCIRNLALKRRVIATMDTHKLYADHTLNVIYTKDQHYDLKYVLGILNSKVVNYLFQHKYLDINIKGVYLEQIPIPKINPDDQHDLRKYNKLLELVDEILILNESYSRTKHPEEQTLIKRKIESIDGEIDQLVYSLYNLDETDIRAIESSPS